MHIYKPVNIMPTFRSALAVLALTIGTVVPGDVSAQIYTNGPLSTGATAENGTPAPAGTTWSELQHDTGVTTLSNTLSGVHGSAPTNRLADDFVVPPGQTWTVSAVDTFAYKIGAAATPSPFTAATLQIWKGRPGDLGSTVLCGDTTTNVLNSSTDALMYRIFNSVVPDNSSAPGTTRKIWRNRLNVPAACAGTGFFTAGTYWIDYDSDNSASFPLVTVAGSRTPPGTMPNARQSSSGVWHDVVDQGYPSTPPSLPQELPFVLSDTIFANGFE